LQLSLNIAETDRTCSTHGRL